MTTSALAAAGVPQPKALVAYTPESALEAIERLGYPAVLKPTVGSWGRLLSKVNDRDAAEAILEHKETLGSYHHSIFYIQEYVKKPGRDIRAFQVGAGDDLRDLSHLAELDHQHGARRHRRATARSRRSSPTSARARRSAVGGGVVALDLFEDPDRGLLVNEVNYTMEFRNSIAPTNVNIPERMVDFCLKVATRRMERRQRLAGGHRAARDRRFRSPKARRSRPLRWPIASHRVRHRRRVRLHRRRAAAAAARPSALRRAAGHQRAARRPVRPLHASQPAAADAPLKFVRVRGARARGSAVSVPAARQRDGPRSISSRRWPIASSISAPTSGCGDADDYDALVRQAAREPGVARTLRLRAARAPSRRDCTARRYVSGVGCNATATTLAIWPLAARAARCRRAASSAR